MSKRCAVCGEEISSSVEIALRWRDNSTRKIIVCEKCFKIFYEGIKLFEREIKKLMIPSFTIEELYELIKQIPDEFTENVKVIVGNNEYDGCIEKKTDKVIILLKYPIIIHHRFEIPFNDEPSYEKIKAQEVCNDSLLVKLSENSRLTKLIGSQMFRINDECD